jgi:hypothetical protein
MEKIKSYKIKCGNNRKLWLMYVAKNALMHLNGHGFFRFLILPWTLLVGFAHTE